MRHCVLITPPHDPSCHIWGHEEVSPVAMLLFMISLFRLVTLALDPMGPGTATDNEGRNNARANGPQHQSLNIMN